MLPSHLATMRAIEQCRTEALGGHLYYCADCDERWQGYHSCRKRHCPKCQQDALQTWLEKQQEKILPIPYFLVTFTLPQSLRSLTRTEQKAVYNLLFRSAAQSLQQLAQAKHLLGKTTDKGTDSQVTDTDDTEETKAVVCPHCGQPMTVIQRIQPRARCPP